MRFVNLVLLGSLASCSYSLDPDLLALRAEIDDLERALPPKAPLWIFEGPDRFDPFIQDYSARVPEYIYLHVVKKLHAMSVSEAEKPCEGDFDAAACEEDPSKFRGRFWRVHGVIGEIHAEPIKEKGFPVSLIHAGVFFDDRARPVLFHVVQKPEVLSLRQDQVETKAVFIKMIEYTTRSGKKIVAPFFIGKVLRRFV